MSVRFGWGWEDDRDMGPSPRTENSDSLNLSVFTQGYHFLPPILKNFHDGDISS